MRKTAGFNCELMSTREIKLFQSLHKWPKTLQLVGRAKLDDAVQYFKTNRKNKNLITGWLKPQESNSQKLDFETFRQQLISEGKMGVIKPYLLSSSVQDPLDKKSQ